MRLFQQYAHTGASEREGGAVSWVFPRPWYQDELDWMTAARQVNTTSQGQQVSAPQSGSRPHDGSIAQPGSNWLQPTPSGAAQPGSA